MLIDAIPETAQANFMPAGGSDPSCFDPREAWYPVSFVADLDPAKPNSFTLLGQDLVIWWEKNTNSWRVFADQCPHRLARLSEGRIADDGLLECPYHGWAFDGDGKCDHIPQQLAGGNAHISDRACVDNFAVAVAQGLLFVYAQKNSERNSHKVKVPIIEAIEQNPADWVCLDIFRDLPYDAVTLLENVLDSSHLPFTHHKSVGNRANAAPVELELIQSDKAGFVGTWPEGPRKGKLGQQNTVFVAPNFMWHDLTSKQFGVTMTVVYATPTRKGECRLFARFPFQFPSQLSSQLPRFLIKNTPQWYSHIGQNAILEDDQIFLHHQERYLSAQIAEGNNVAKAYYLPTKADLFVTEFRKWLDQYQADPFAGQSLPPTKTKSVLLDRYHSHTLHCRSCRTALQNIQRLKISLVVIGAIVLIASPLLNQYSGFLVAILASVALAWVVLNNFEQKFYFGSEIPARNRV